MKCSPLSPFMMTRILEPMHRSISSKGINWEVILFDVDCDMSDSTSSPHDVCALQSAIASREVATIGTGWPDSRGPSRRAAEVYMGSGKLTIVTDPTILSALHSCIAIVSFLRLLSHAYRFSSIRGKECHICGQHAAMPQHECQTSTSRGTCPAASGKATRIRTIMSTPEPAPPTGILSVFSASLLNALSIEDGTSHEDSSSPSDPMF
jgi:hypothetical protein